VDIREIPVPPEAEVIKLARMAGRLGVDDAVARVRAAGGQVSATYWRDIERGHGGRRGKRVPARASDSMLAQMAHAAGASPEQLRDAAAGHPEGEDRARVVRQAAQVLEEIQRRDGPHYRRPPPPAAAPLAGWDDEVGIRVEVARRSHPSGPLSGVMVFPVDPLDAAAWDRLAGLGIGEGGLVQGVAAVRAWRQQAAGLENGFATGRLAPAEASSQGRM
jgi:hypothetical protein